MKKIKTPERIVLPHYIILIIDVCIVLSSIIMSFLLRFNFSIPQSELQSMPKILIFITAVRIILFVSLKSYYGIIKYNNFFDMLKIYLFTIIGSLIFILSNIVSYYFINKTLFIPLTIIIIEFLLTSFLLILLRSLIKMGYSSTLKKNLLERLKIQEKKN